MVFDSSPPQRPRSLNRFFRRFWPHRSTRVVWSGCGASACFAFIALSDGWSPRPGPPQPQSASQPNGSDKGGGIALRGCAAWGGGGEAAFWFILGVGCRWQQQAPGDSQHGCRERLRQRRVLVAWCFVQCNALSPLCGVVQQPELIAVQTLIADRSHDQRWMVTPGPLK